MVDRIQRLLCTEYDDFSDLVLLECLFAETSRDGNGIMQVQMGLTRGKLILAGLFAESQREPAEKDPKGAELDCLELLSITPIDAVSLTVFRRRTRNTIKAHFSNDVIRYFELAAPVMREMFWRMWLEKLDQLAPEAVTSTQSETSVGTSSSALSVARPGYPSVLSSITWPMRDVYLGSTFGQGETKRRPLLCGASHVPREVDTELTPLNRRPRVKVLPVNRFGSGVDERCSTALFLPAQISVTPNFEPGWHSTEFLRDSWTDDTNLDWEPPAPKRKPLHPRRYGLATMPHLLFGLGLWVLSTPDAAVMQLRKSSSCVSLRTTKKIELSLDLPKRLLVSTVSSDNLLRYENQSSPQMVFWTPGYWYKPRSVAQSYFKLRRHIQQVNTYIKDSTKRKTWFGKYSKNNMEKKSWKKKKNEVSLEEKDFRSRLRIDINLTSWDFDSTLIAHQITLIDREFFLRIPVKELLVLMMERNSRNSPNFRAWVAFSNRLFNLISTEIIRINSVKMRARLIARWINVTDKLHRLQNLQGTRTVLLALQSPAVFRLSQTWAALRKYHNTKYRRLLTLMSQTSEPRSEGYANLMSRVTKTLPYLPALEYIAAVLLGWTPPAPNFKPSRPEEDAHRLWRAWRFAVESYGLKETPLVKEFLTKTRYLEERENLALAVSLEPSNQN